MNKKIKVAIGMSGGVDSSVSALLLAEAGYDVVGLFMKLWHDPCGPEGAPFGGAKQNACCDDKSLADAHLVAKKIGIPLYEVDVRAKFKAEVTDYFIDEYKNLRTPNPCVVCNKKIKFGWLLDFAEKLGCDKLATGHYCRITDNHGVISNGSEKSHVQEDLTPRSAHLDGGLAMARDDSEKTFHLLKGRDESKDQSYFLYQLNQDQLSKLIFPVGEMTKDAVRQIAREHDLIVAEKGESQEVCFVSDNDYRKFLRRNIAPENYKPGKIVDQTGHILGEHDGLINYTMGQRRGIEQTKKAGSTETQPKYVIGFNALDNELVVGDGEEVKRSEFEIREAHWINGSPELGARSSGELKVKIRYKAQEIPCTIYELQNSIFDIHLSSPARAITPGQSAVFYDGDEVIGGGIIV